MGVETENSGAWQTAAGCHAVEAVSLGARGSDGQAQGSCAALHLGRVNH